MTSTTPRIFAAWNGRVSIFAGMWETSCGNEKHRRVRVTAQPRCDVLFRASTWAVPCEHNKQTQKNRPGIKIEKRGGKIRDREKQRKDSKLA